MVKWQIIRGRSARAQMTAGARSNLNDCILNLQLQNPILRTLPVR